AGKAFMGVALLYDDPAITPRALQKAAFAYQKAGKKDEADRVAKELHEKYPDFAGGYAARLSQPSKIVIAVPFCLDNAMEKFRPCIAECIGTFALIFVGIAVIKTAGHAVLA